MCAVRVDDALCWPTAWRVVRGFVNFAVQGDGFAGAFAADLVAIMVQQSQISGV